MRRSDIISGIGVALFGLAMIFIVVPAQIKSTSDYGLDPKFFPVLLLWLLVAMGVMLVGTRLMQPVEPGGESKSEPVLDRWNWAFIGGAAAFLILVFVAMKFVGFVITGSVMLAIAMFAIEPRRLNWFEVIGVSALAPFIINWLLYNIFSVQLPSGTLFP